MKRGEESNNMDLESALGGVELFQGLDKKDLREITQRMRTITYEPDHTIIQENSGGIGGMGIILKGSCRIEKNGQIINRLGPGEVFGEMSLIDERPRSASVITDEATEAAELSAWEFRSQIKENPEIAINLLRTLSARLRSP